MRPPVPTRLESPEPLSPRQREKRSALRKVLRIGDESHRVRAVREIAPFAGDANVRSALQRALLSDRRPLVRKTVAEVFGHLGDDRNLPTLRQAYAEDPERSVRQAAYRAIIMLEGYSLDSD